MGVTGFQTIDRNISSRNVGLIGYKTNIDVAARFLMSCARNAMLDSNCSTLFLHPNGIQSLDALRPKQQGKQYVENDSRLSNQLEAYESQCPLGTNSGSIRYFDSLLNGYSGNRCPTILMVLFKVAPQEEMYYELKALRKKHNVTSIIAIPGDLAARRQELQQRYKPGAMKFVDYFAQLNDNSPTLLDIMNDAAEEVAIDIATGITVLKNQGAGGLTLAQVQAELYDLRDYQSQQKDPEKVKRLLARYEELVGPNKRPSFMK